MPLFGGRFSPKLSRSKKKSPSLNSLNNDRALREAEMGLDSGPMRLDSGAANLHREMAKVQKENQVLNEENNLLKLKVEMLLDLLAETTAEVHLQENEIEQLKAVNKKSKS